MSFQSFPTSEVVNAGFTINSTSYGSSSCAVSYDGSKIAFGATNQTTDNGSQGIVQVFSNSSGSFTPEFTLSDPYSIDGTEGFGNNIGTNISLNRDGTRLFVRNSNDQLRFFTYDSGTNSWSFEQTIGNSRTYAISSNSTNDALYIVNIRPIFGNPPSVNYDVYQFTGSIYFKIADNVALDPQPGDEVETAQCYYNNDNGVLVLIVGDWQNQRVIHYTYDFTSNTFGTGTVFSQAVSEFGRQIQITQETNEEGQYLVVGSSANTFYVYTSDSVVNPNYTLLTSVSGSGDFGRYIGICSQTKHIVTSNTNETVSGLANAGRVSILFLSGSTYVESSFSMEGTIASNFLGTNVAVDAATTLAAAGAVIQNNTNSRSIFNSTSMCLSDDTKIIKLVEL